MIKRGLDLVSAAVALLVLWPVLLLASLVVWMTLGSPVFFRQPRAGLAGRPFELIKFRTMTNERDGQGHLLPDDQRLGRLGRLLRSTSIDELPSLWCLFRGHVSLVGPRPLLLEYLPLYTLRQARRHEVRPGITGWAQVNGRNSLEWSDRLAMDVWYVDHQSLALDLSILWRTVITVLRRDGIQYHGGRSMPRFTGAPDVTPPAERCWFAS